MYVSHLFQGSQLNQAALTKEAFAIHMLVKKQPFYLADRVSSKENVKGQSQ